ncbi:MAG: ATP-grasp domain-containing protein [Endomicrobiales bacterium]|nr:ATP-grasp domain-containing protein [Endomicrobiales bacterium]
MPRVLITDAAQRTSLYVIRSLGARGMDITATESRIDQYSNLGFASKYPKRRVLVPDPVKDPDAYLQKLLELASEHDAIFPITMFSLKTVSKNLEAFRKLTRVAVADYNTLMRANDTGSALRAAAEAGIPCPSTYNISNENDIEKLSEGLPYPVFIKVRDELELAPGQRHAIARSKKEFLIKYKYLHSLQSRPIVQEFLEGDGCGFFTMFGSDGEPKVLFTHRRVREYPLDGGPSTFCRSLRDEKLIEYGTKLLKKLNWYGIAMAEFKYDSRDNDPKFMEINPRIWGSAPLAVFSGIDFPYLWYKLAAGEKIEPVLKFKENVKLRFLFNDVQAAAASVLNGKRFFRYFFGFLIDLFDFRVRDGIISFSDAGPGLTYLLKAFSRLLFFIKPASPGKNSNG